MEKKASKTSFTSLNKVNSSPSHSTKAQPHISDKNIKVVKFHHEDHTGKLGCGIFINILYLTKSFVL